MKLLGVELSHNRPPDGPAEHTLVQLENDGRVGRVERPESLPAVAAAVSRLVSGETFLLAVDIPVVVPARATRSRAVENVVRRRFGYRLPPGGRGAKSSDSLGVPGEALLAGLAAAGLPCLPFPDRDRRKSGLVETHPGVVAKVLAWQSSPITDARDQGGREELFRAYSVPAYRRSELPARASWADQAVALELALRAMGRTEGYDVERVWKGLARASSVIDVERAAALLDAILIASTARRYVDAPEQSLFLGDTRAGYLVLPADGFIRRLAHITDRPARGELFPQASLRERLGGDAKLRAMELLSVPGRPGRIDASFSKRPCYEFDNLDEMLWWKHCRHLAGPRLPTEGLCELDVVLGLQDDGASHPTLRLVRSRHRTLSFRFDPPANWRDHVPTRDGKVYPFRVLRAVYETLPTDS